MGHINYIVIGDDAGAVGAIEGIRLLNQGASILLVCPAKRLPYSNEILLPFLAGKVREKELILRPDRFFKENGIQIQFADKPSVVRPDRKIVVINGTEHFYDSMLISGHCFGGPSQINGGEDCCQIRSADDVQVLKQRLESVRRAVVIGHGLRALKVGEALFNQGVQTTIVLEPCTSDPYMDAQLVALAAERLVNVGLCVFNGDKVEMVRRDESGTLRGVHLANGKFLKTDILVDADERPGELNHVVSSTTDWKDGLIVNANLQTCHEGLFAVADAAIRDRAQSCMSNAYQEGVCAGRGMAGELTTFDDINAVTSYDFYGYPVISSGIVSGDERSGVEVCVAEGEKVGGYRKLFFHDSRLVGYALAGDISAAGKYTAFIRHRIAIDEMVKRALKEGLPSPFLWPGGIWDSVWAAQK